MQAFDLDTKAKFKETHLTEAIRFWRWIDEDTLGIVGKTNVYHTRITDAAAPEKVFEQDGKFANAQIMNYGTDSPKKWCYLIGIYQGANNQICCHL